MSFEERLPDFNDKIVSFYLSAGSGVPAWLTEGAILRSPTFELQGGRLFVTGRTLDNSHDETDKEWSDDRNACLAWESVLFYVALPTNEYWSFRKRDDERDDQTPEVAGKAPLTRGQLLGLIISILFMLILLALLVAIIVWIVNAL